MKRIAIVLFSLLALAACQREEPDLPEATTTAQRLYLQYADRQDLTVALLGEYEGYNAVMLQADDREGWHRLLDEFGVTIPVVDEKPGMKVSQATVQGARVLNEEEGTGDLLASLFDSPVSVSIDSAYTIHSSAQYDHGRLVASSCDTSYGLPPVDTAAAPPLLQTALNNGKRGYLCYTDSQHLALWIFFYSDSTSFSHIVNTITNI